MPMVDDDAVQRILTSLEGVDFNATPVDPETVLSIIVKEVLDEVRKATVTTPSGNGTIT